MTTPSWQEVWNRRSGKEGEDVLQSLIDLDGFDTGAGKISAADWRAYAGWIADRLGVGPGKSVFEVGCGSGAFLYVLRERGATVGGIDFAANLLEHARRVLAGGDFVHGNAAELPAQPGYDFAVANSVFHYFPDEPYAQAVLGRMLDKAGSAVAVLDVPDAATRDEAERVRSAGLSADEYQKKYAGLHHRYYPRRWFEAKAAQRGWRCETFDQRVAEYGQSSFRFNAVLTRP
jgi:ubiquinone/menaquinone biosynthesis C-methylase UbiE